MMHIILYPRILRYPSECLARLRLMAQIIEIHDTSHIPSLDQSLEHISIVFTELGYIYDRSLLEKMPSLKYLCSNTTTTPHIDSDFCRFKHIEVLSLEHQQEFLHTITPVAEHTFGLLIALQRNYYRAFNSVFIDKEWDRYQLGGRKMLSRQTLGIIGLGRIGSRVKIIAEAFGMNTICCDPLLAGDNNTKLDFLLENADAITLHCGLNSTSANLLSTREFSKMHKKPYIINTSRPEVINEQALCEALTSHQISGAALDCLINEHNPSFLLTAYNPLIELQTLGFNILVTPHIGGSTQDAWDETKTFICDRLLQLI